VALVGVTTIAIGVGEADGGVIDTAVRSFRRFYPNAEIQLDSGTVRISSANLPEAQLRTAWLSQLLEAKTHAQSELARAAVLERLFR